MTGSVLTAPVDFAGPGRTLFLAGGIMHCPPWQDEVVAALADLDVVLLNPRRAAFPMGDPDGEVEQIDWEHRHLAIASSVLFWFPASDPALSVQPIALYELGWLAHSDRPIAVGVDPAYPRRQDVLLQLSHARPGLPVHDTLPDTVAAARSLLTGLG
ncbi:hypothetical protein F0L68_32625 [Solihabitans fulvus]|uniref:Nucleoside 2-deoxyribosyltransferase like n=1 Tax=Solihabitans fulvus TaxID=1892852 RepID=A0A5B2WRD6_9PSEU|nr:nucleoside 2-deoxyribosyltransferase domain-containing protein [Solihabitans fulvus]KAA2253554.1 hypothetical protein F0L68_32625 [Solihabitans fulvus]